MAGRRKEGASETLRLLGANVRRRRLETGLTQAELADLARVSQSQINTLESGTREAGVVALVRVALALHVDPADLLRGVR
ncbi:MAG: helix-turn-helix transcriptional regulator [Solirubrobacterales bacterium]|nr:helix-turn-helix transcriptional regulator [Solirubrobacterales bacterium]